MNPLLPLLLLSGSGERPDALHLALLTRDGPARLELRVEVGGRPVFQRWGDAFDALHAFYDRDGDGALGRAEAARLPSAFGLRQVLWGQFTPFSGDAPPLARLDANADGQVSRDELAGFYRRAGLGNVLVGAGRPPSTVRLTDAILKAVDANADGHTDEPEWAKAPAALARLDANGDELVGPGELSDGTAYPGATGSVLVSESESDVCAYVAKSPAVAWALSADGPPVRRTHAVGGLTLDLRTDAGQLPGLTAAARKRLAAQFAEADADRDGTLDAAELSVPKASTFTRIRDAADRDGNQSLSRAEFDAWFGLQERVADAHVLLTVLDHGAGLFEALDADRDGGLGARELRGAWAALTAAGCVTGDRFDRARLPRLLSACVSRGHPRSPLPTPTRPGPPWLLAMDRNGDGDVSAREWAAEPGVFRALDADGDGLLSAAEAGRAGK